MQREKDEYSIYKTCIDYEGMINLMPYKQVKL